MPTIVPGAPLGRPSRGASIETEWLDGKTRIFKRGDDFQVRPEEFARQFRRAAQRAGQRGKCDVLDDDTVQARSY